MEVALCMKELDSQHSTIRNRTYSVDSLGAGGGTVDRGGDHRARRTRPQGVGHGHVRSTSQGLSGDGQAGADIRAEDGLRGNNGRGARDNRRRACGRGGRARRSRVDEDGGSGGGGLVKGSAVEETVVTGRSVSGLRAGGQSSQQGDRDLGGELHFDGNEGW